MYNYSIRKYKRSGIMNINYAGTDLGFDTVKLSVGGNKYSFPSLAKEDNTEELNYDNSKNVFSKGKMLIEVRDHGQNYKFMIGDYVTNQLQKGGFDFNITKFKKTSELAKFLSAFSLAYPEETNIIVDTLVTGLPIRDFSEYKEDMIERLEGDFEAKIHNSEGKLVTVNYQFKNVHVIPQAVSALFNHVHNSNIDMKKEIIAIADIGGLTTDLVAFNKGNLIKNSAVSLRYGMSNVFDLVADHYNVESSIVRETVVNNDNIINTGQGKKNIRRQLEIAMETVAKDISSELNNKWRDFIGTLDRIITVGGGAESLNNHLQSNLLNVKLDLAKDARFYNAKGYELRAKKIYEEQNKDKE